MAEEVNVEREINDHVTAVKADTLKLIVQISKRLNCRYLLLMSTRGKPIQMMGLPQEEVERVILKLLSFGLFEAADFNSCLADFFCLVIIDGECEHPKC
ncbi:hypothetical protein Tco_0864738 [Tanacetum coccineum]